MSLKYRFGKVDPLVKKVTWKFGRELSRNEAHSYAYILQHKSFSRRKNDLQEKVNDLRAPGFYSDPVMLFENISPSEDAVHNTMCYVNRSKCSRSLCRILKRSSSLIGTRRSFERTTSWFGVFPAIVQYGLTHESQFRLHDELSPHLSSTINFGEV